MLDLIFKRRVFRVCTEIGRYKPQEKTIRAIQQLAAPKNKRQLRTFLEMINYYREMVRNKSAFLKPLTVLTSIKVHFIRTSAVNSACDGINKECSFHTIVLFGLQ